MGINYRKKYNIIEFSLLMLSITFFSEIFLMGFSPLTPYLANEFNLNEAQIGLFSSALALGGLISSLPVGIIMDRYGLKSPINISILIPPLMFIALSYAFSFYIIFFLCFLSGIMVSIGNIGTGKASTLIPKEYRATTIGIAQTGPNVAGSVSSIVLPFLSASFSWQIGSRAIGGFLLFIGFFLIIRLREYLDNNGKNSYRKTYNTNLLYVLKNKKFVLSLIIYALLISSVFSYISFFVLYLNRGLFVTPAFSGFSLFVSQAVAIISRPMSGVISDRFFAASREKTIKVLSLMSFVSIVYLAYLPLNPNKALVIIAAFILGFFLLGIRPMGTALAVESVDPKETGRALAVLSIVSWISIMLIAPFFGFLVTYTESWRIAWIFISVLIIAPYIILSLKSVEKDD